MPSPGPTLVWLRRDLRLADQPALHAASERGGPVIPVFIHAPEEEAPWAPGAASNWWLHHSLQALDHDLRAQGSRLTLRAGPSLATLRALVRETGATAVYWNRLYDPAFVLRDPEIKAGLRADGLEVHSFNAHLLIEPWEVATGQGRPYKVFSPFWKACLKHGIDRDPLPAADALAPPDAWPESLDPEQLELLPTIDWAAGLRATWNPGETAAGQRLAQFLDGAVRDYGVERDRPDHDGTSRLSPHLHFGEVSPRQILRALRQAGLHPDHGGPEAFVRELGWRDFAHHVLYHFPYTPDQPLNPRFEAFPWREDNADLHAWQHGRTGLPIVDAAMQQLWQTGWMHNRLRMVVGSFLTKNLRQHWRHGARWFWDTLVDADLAANTLGWQWAGGCGADAAPYFRVFNPQTQGERHDPDGAYVRHFVPVLKDVETRYIHAPGAGGARGYPAPIVDLKASRQAALEAFQAVKDH
ncbi:MULTISPECIES: deoxyribodipyrimidine photo-lyase [unclassified Thioalkalivibrio]|uniref:cryptochrome/photolyase family protein n=1 Tax=unclassified Thioalkalivibrio TaxID=2621013 RepID=UPI00037516E5|nr:MULTISPECIES: deoxyribodipyrimidine photo-lyase [unclassified Thioalkalivibrio]